MNYRALKGVHCPACGLRCVVSIHTDFADCPEHGPISGLLLLECRGMAPWEALVEIKAAQIIKIARWRFSELERWLYNDSYLKIRVPYIV